MNNVELALQFPRPAFWQIVLAGMPASKRGGEGHRREKREKEERKTTPACVRARERGKERGDEDEEGMELSRKRDAKGETYRGEKLG